MTLPPDDYIVMRVKAELRKRMRGLRNTLPFDAVEQRSLRIRDQLLEHPAIEAAATVAMFWPMRARHEVDLAPLFDLLRARSKRVALPALLDLDEAHEGQRDMVFRFVDDPSVLSEQGHGFAEPPVDAPLAEQLDVIVVPALAVEARGYRLGYGAGFYDRALTRFAQATSIAVAFDFQLLVEVPIAAHDVPVQHVVTDARAFAVPRV
jgi:5-formyltetrahydrofolate cyclo-ligase